jgi:uncharacterized membrane protein YoaK (UPF0700 family)
MNASPLPARRVAGYARVLLLVGVAGYVDAFGLLNFQTFVSFMSGNTTTAGLEIGLASAGAALPPLFAVVFFVVGVFLGAMIAVANPVRAQQLCFALVAALIAAFMIAARGGGLNNLVSIATLSLAMGLLNTTVSRIGVEPVNVGYVSGTLSKMADHAARAVARQPLPDAQARWDTHAWRALLLAGVWTVFFVGAILSGAATVRFGADALLVPFAALFALAVWDVRRISAT